MADREFTADPRVLDGPSADPPISEEPTEAELLAEARQLTADAATALSSAGAPVPNFAALEGRREELRELCQRAMRGQLARHRRLKANEPDRLDERHINMICMRHAGMKQMDIAQLIGVTDVTVSIVLNHPDAQTILSVMAGYAADNAVDLNKRIQETAPEAFQAAVEVMRTTVDEKIKAKTAFEILALAGYGKTQKIEIDDKRMPVQDPAAVNNLASAIREASSIQKLEYARFTEVKPMDTVIAAPEPAAPPPAISRVA